MSWPCRAGPVVPPTGHSTKAAPLRAHLVGERELGRGLHRAHLDEQLAAHVAGEQSGRPVIDRIDRGGVGEDGDDRLARAAQVAAGVAATVAPAAASGFALSAVRFHTVTAWPTSISRCAIAAPIMPRPATPTCMDELRSA